MLIPLRALSLLLLLLLFQGALRSLPAQDYTIFDLNGKYDEDPGSYYLRVRFNFVDQHADSEATAWWAVGGFDLAEEAAMGLRNLNEAFGPHGIYFFADAAAPDCSTPVGYYTYAGLHNPAGKSLLNLLREDYQSLEEAAHALNIYITSDQGLGSGNNFTVPSNKIALKGLGSSGLVTRSTVLIQAAGHALGLLKTFTGAYPEQGECNEEAPTNYNCNIPYSLCACCGDYVCDTDYSLNTHIVLDPTDCSGAPSVPQSVRRNYMSSVTPGRCRHTFTEEQVRRMKKYLRELHSYPYWANLLYDLQVQEAEYPGVTPSGVTGNFTVASDVLELTSPLQMLPGATITVKTGATLHIKTALTAACDTMWRGIKVESGGRVKVFGQGTIEHAICGIDAVGNSSEVVIFGGALVNNTIGLRVDADDAIETSNQVFFANFELNDQYRGAPDERPYFIVLRGNRGTKIRNTTFQDERAGDCSGSADCTFRAVGIMAEDASFVCSSNTVFSNLLKGIEVSNLGVEQGSYRIKNCAFVDNLIGIVSRECSSLLIEGNTFQLDRASNYENFEPFARSLGVLLIGESQGFTIARNEFLQLGGFEGCNYFGTICAGTGQGLNNEVVNNKYITMEVGNAALGNNGDELGGVVYLCNDHSAEPPGVAPGLENCVDYLIEPGATIRKEQQGMGQQGAAAPAGNIFSSSAPIENQSGAEDADEFYEFNYYYALNDPSQNPGSPNGVTPIGLDALPNCEEADCLPPCPVPLPGLKALFWGAQARVNNLKLSVQGRKRQPSAIHHWEQQRRKAAGQILRYYALDTVAVEADSIRQWLSNANTFGSLYLLAREAFFFGDMAEFQSTWESIPQRVERTAYQIEVYNSLSALFSTLQPFFSEAGRLRQIPPPLLEALLGFTAHCNEAGHLAVELLRRNGIEAAVQCNGQSQALAQKGSREKQAQDVRRREGRLRAALFPNPTQGTLQAALPEGAGQASLILYNLQGQPAFQSVLTGQYSTLQLPVPSGIYWARLQIAGQQPEHHKIIVSR